MPWTRNQHFRILEEEEILSVYFPGRVSWLHGRTNVEIRMTTNNGNEYTLRAYLPEDFPNSVPDLVVTQSPQPMPNWENSGQTHTLPRYNGFLRICHYRISRWSPQNNLYDVFMKGRLWLEAYEGHLRTSLPLDHFLRDMEIKQ